MQISKEELLERCKAMMIYREQLPQEIIVQVRQAKSVKEVFQLVHRYRTESKKSTH